ncbi:unnamed protein product [Linum tenue]|uniref:Uncharacterized protein n=1 Tax=Linum tenue TaxID=586396 RepID=A0AAV0QML7_9ROSI|nr:unnamed protein product [Linum tenue]
MKTTDDDLYCKKYFRKGLTVSTSSFFLTKLYVVPRRIATSAPIFLSPFFQIYVMAAGLALQALVEALVRPRPDKPLGRRIKLLLDLACLQAALLARHYYDSANFSDRDLTNRLLIIRIDLFSLVVSASVVVYGAFFAFLCSPDVRVRKDLLVVVLMQSLVYWIPDGFMAMALAIQCCVLLICVRYHRYQYSALPTPPPQSPEKKKKMNWFVELMARLGGLGLVVCLLILFIKPAFESLSIWDLTI